MTEECHFAGSAHHITAADVITDKVEMINHYFLSYVRRYC